MEANRLGSAKILKGAEGIEASIHQMVALLRSRLPARLERIAGPSARSLVTGISNDDFGITVALLKPQKQTSFIDSDGDRIVTAPAKPGLSALERHAIMLEARALLDEHGGANLTLDVL